MTREIHLPLPSAGRGADADPADDLAVEKLSDLALLASVRRGDDQAFGELYHRHSGAVRAFAVRNFGATMDADDLTAEAFFRVLQAVRRGTARIDHMRAYLLTVTRRVGWEWAARRRDVPVDDAELSRRTGAARDRSANSAERHLITQAFTSLPERWRSVLWRVEVEGERPAVIAGHLGLSPNATAALARRARDGLRAAYLQAHLADSRGPVSCRNVVEKLGAFTAGGVRGAEERRIEAHLRDCASCTALQAELAEVCAGLRVHASAVMGPAIGLGTALAPHFGAAGTSGVGAMGAAGSVGSVGKFFGAAGKFAATGGRLKVAVTASAAAAVGVMGVAVGPVLNDHQDSNLGFDGQRGNDVIEVCTTCVPGDRGIAALPGTSFTPTSPAQRSSDGRSDGVAAFDANGVPAADAVRRQLHTFDGGRRTADGVNVPGLPGSFGHSMADGMKPQSGTANAPETSRVRPSKQNLPGGWPIPQSPRPPATPSSPPTDTSTTATSTPTPAPESGPPTSSQQETGTGTPSTQQTSTSRQTPTTEQTSTTQQSPTSQPQPLPMHPQAGR